MQEAAASGGELPLEYLLRVMRDKEATNTRRDAAASSAAPYLHARAPTPYVAKVNPQPFTFVAPTNATEATAALANLATRIAAGEVDLDVATAITNTLKLYIVALGDTEFEGRLAAVESVTQAGLQ
jgi:hypothetical protein